METELSSEVERAVRLRLDRDIPEIRKCRDEVRSYVDALCAALSRDDFRFRLSEVRIKDTRRILKKLARKGGDADSLYNDVGDVIGLRVVVYNLSDIDAFRARLRKDRKKPLTGLRYEQVERASGYRALHINAHTKGETPFSCEIQIRTALQDAWGIATREDFYDLDDPPDPFLGDLARAQADIVHAVDKVMQQLRDRRTVTNPEVVAGPADTLTDNPDTAPSASTPPSLRDSLVRSAVEALDSSERYVLEHPISATRVAELKDAVTRARIASSLKALFDAAGSYERRFEYNGDRRFGSSLIGWKGPLVDGSNWASYTAREFEQALERYLQGQLGVSLAQSTNVWSPPSWAEFDSFVRSAARDLSQRGYQGDVLFVSGQLPTDYYEYVRWRGKPFQFRGREMSEVYLDSQVGEIPAVRLTIGGPALIALVDLTRAFRLIQWNPDPMSNNDTFFRVDEITFDRAIDMLERNPGLLQPADGPPRTREEQVVHLQLRVVLHLIESGLVELIDPQGIRKILLPPSKTE